MNTPSLLQTGLALVLVIGLVLLLGWGVQRLGGPRRTRELAVLSQVSVGQRERVVVVAWDGQEWLLGVGPGRVNLITQRESQAQPQQDPAAPGLRLVERPAAEGTDGPRPSPDAAARPSLPQAFSIQLQQAFAVQLQQTLARWGAR